MRAAGYTEIQLHLLRFQMLGIRGGNSIPFRPAGNCKASHKIPDGTTAFPCLDQLEQIVGLRRHLEHEPAQNEWKRDQ